VTSALDMQRRRASAIARELVDRAPAGSILAIFAGGSLGRGEVWSARADDRLEVYSDIDLYVVVAGPGAGRAVRTAAKAVGDGAGPPGGDEVVFLRAPEFGVYTREDLRAQPVRPGTVDLAVHHVVLHGDPELARTLPRADPARIARDEALYLLENRVAELSALDPGAPGAAGRQNRVAALKARLDVHAAHLIVRGEFVPTRSERAARFAADPSTFEPHARDDMARAYRAAAELERWIVEADAPGEIARALGALRRAWLDLAPKVLAASADAAPARLLARRCREGARVANARELWRLRRAAGTPLHRVLPALPGLARFSPRTALRVDALVRCLRAGGEIDARDASAHERYADALTRCFGFTAGPPEVRARTMHGVIS
jgi:hypothetical protein